MDSASDWLPPRLIERMTRRRGRLHAFETLVPHRTALVVIDLTVLFTIEPPRIDAVVDAETVVANVNRLAAALRAAGGTVAWTRPASDAVPPLLAEILGAGPAAHYRAGAAEGDPRAALHPGLEVRPGDLQGRKTLYSAFFPGACDLPGRLAERGIDTVLIAGAVTHVCCEASARDAYSCGFRTVLLADACLGTEPEHRVALASIYRNFGDVRTTAETIGLLQGGAGGE
ncbi:MAG: cysteine hydrolase family protein [Inquilinus sp.]|uniref:cysteine hydrolase family protein n=1 Tax=Inquilinus sp. TaxID=1932117 RepID=UPI003F301AB8